MFYFITVCDTAISFVCFLEAIVIFYSYNSIIFEMTRLCVGRVEGVWWKNYDREKSSLMLKTDSADQTDRQLQFAYRLVMFYIFI